MRRGPLILMSVTGIASATLAVLACTTDYQKGLDDPNYGAPNALAGQQQPGSSTDYATSTSEGGSPGAGSSGGVTPLCVQQGGAVIDGGACAVSFANDILKMFGAAGCDNQSCHGGATPLNPPGIEPGDPKGTYDKFVAFKLSTGVPYINPCSTDKTKAGIACNVSATGTCGTIMPSGTQGLPADQVTKLQTWLGCGSPNN